MQLSQRCQRLALVWLTQNLLDATVAAQAQAWAKEAGIPVVCAYHTHFAQYLTYYHLGALEGAIWCGRDQSEPPTK